MYKQILLDGREITVYSQSEWAILLQKHCDKNYKFCANYWFCDFCNKGSCSQTIIDLLLEAKEHIDYSDLDFEYYVKKASDIAYAKRSL